MALNANLPLYSTDRTSFRVIEFHLQLQILLEASTLEYTSVECKKFKDELLKVEGSRVLSTLCSTVD